MNDSTAIKIIAILAIAILESAALVMGIDGAFFGPAIAAIGGIAGYEIRGLQTSQKTQKKETETGG